MKGICFIPPLFKATVAGLKTQTRRIMDTQPDDSGLHDHTNFPLSVDSKLSGYWGTVAETGEDKEFKPRYKAGETVYLKEPYKVFRGGDDAWRFLYPTTKDFLLMDTEKVKHFSHVQLIESINRIIKSQNKSKSGYANKLFMPEWAARHYIDMLAIHPERLQDISDEDCFKEGIFLDRSDNPWSGLFFNGLPKDIGYLTPKEAYASLIDKINGKGTWDSNPFVWVYDYELTRKKQP